MTLVVDASVTLAWALPDEENEAANKAMFEAMSNGAIVPFHWILEVANSLLIAHRRNRIALDELKESLAVMKELRLEVDGLTGSAATEKTAMIAVEHGLTVYDAAYLELALRTDYPLATLDQELSTAAIAMGISIFKSGE